MGFWNGKCSSPRAKSGGEGSSAQKEPKIPRFMRRKCRKSVIKNNNNKKKPCCHGEMGSGDTENNAVGQTSQTAVSALLPEGSQCC